MQSWKHRNVYKHAYLPEWLEALRSQVFHPELALFSSLGAPRSLAANLLVMMYASTHSIVVKCSDGMLHGLPELGDHVCTRSGVI
jgi:hypothetical protein